MKVAVLGPKGTYCDVARKEINDSFVPVYYPSIHDSFMGFMKNETEYCILPYENSLDGFVQNSMDLLLTEDIQITEEIYLPISFSLVGNVDAISEIERLFVQFKTKGQCLELIQGLPMKNLYLTESNILSLEEVKKGRKGDAAIIPNHSLRDNHFAFVKKDVMDKKNNSTRFLVIKKGVSPCPKKNVKSLLIISSLNDRPGMLYDILGIFYKKNINLISIVSRAQKSEIGKYNFYIEISVSDVKVIHEVMDSLQTFKDIRVFNRGIFENKDKLHSI